MNSELTYTNRLINETSPYLLQHAHNPVDWYPWGEEALFKAKSENKLMLISIGYSSCHWCHVMERECFENEDIAAIMNENFVCIKVDREERPDIDRIYMDAVQLMTGSGGWPLNCFTLPDGRPIYGGTYFPPKNWAGVLMQLSNLYRQNPAKVNQYADELTQGVKAMETILPSAASKELDSIVLEKSIEKWKLHFDNEEGGPKKAPKFPLPNNYIFLLQYAHLTNDSELLKHVYLTLDKMALGGIYDQIGGGFTRYSTDMLWKVPHFEKMLYDNGQLLSLYALAYQKSKNELYKEIAYSIATFIEREMTSPKGAFYSAIDADSEGEEGKYYIWKLEEVKEILKDDFELAKNYFNFNEDGYWEHGNYIPLRKITDEEFAKQHHIDVQTLKIKVKKIKETLLTVRQKRVYPLLDDKILASWNALMIKGFVDAAKIFNENVFLDAAIKANKFICDNLIKDGVLYHSYKNGKLGAAGFLEDYAFLADALLSLFEITAVKKYLDKAIELSHYAIEHFYDEKSGMFFYTADNAEQLIARKMEVTDNVIPASNSVMANVLYRLYRLTDNTSYYDKTIKMLKAMQEFIHGYGSAYSNWMMLQQQILGVKKELVICGNKAKQFYHQVHQHYLPDTLVVFSEKESALPLFKGRFKEGKTTLYYCLNNACQMPVENVEDVLKQMSINE
ncbi:MAG: thioredoxin [Bacteroidia bacterium]|nr:MAG: thioredoxin [Bacteroidia bacterium]